MKDERLEQVLLEAHQRAALPAFNGQPWPVVVFSIVGAWVVALPALAALALILVAFGASSSGPFLFMGVAVMLVSLMVDWNLNNARFTEQLNACLLVCGGGMVATVIYLEYIQQAAMAIFALALICAFITKTEWLRPPLAAVAAIALQFALIDMSRYYDLYMPQLSLYGLEVNVALWLLVLLGQHSHHTGLLSAAWLQVESVANGWLLATCAGLAIWSGSTFLLDAQLPSSGYEMGAVAQIGDFMSPLLVLLAAGWFMQRWSSLRNWRWCGVALAVAELAWFSPALGPAVLCATASMLYGKTRLALLAGMCAVWIIGSAYYQLSWPLILKAMVFGSVGCVMLTCAYAPGLGVKRRAILSKLDQPIAEEIVDHRRIKRNAGGCLIAVLLLANVMIMQREYQIEHGAQVFVRLAPRDPRSLMQGDYMALNTELSGPLYRVHVETGQHRAVLLVGADKVVTGIQQWVPDRPLRPNEYLVEFETVSGSAVLASNAWYFAEGDARRWENARFGEYRISPQGRALLVGLRGAALAPL